MRKANALIRGETDVVGKTPFFIRAYHVKETKQILYKEMKRLCPLVIFKERLFYILQSLYVKK